MRKITARIRRDLADWGKPLLLVAAYLCLMTFVFHKRVCPLAAVTGLPCPGCGMTRAVLLLAQGQFSQAWEIHPFVYPLAILALLAIVLRYGLGQKIRWMEYVLIPLGIGAIVYYVYRMLAWFPAREPMVYEPDNLMAHLRLILNGLPL